MRARGRRGDTETPDGSPTPDPSDLDGYDLTEDGVALAFAAKFQDQLRYCHHAGVWYKWTGTHWQREETKLAFSWARHTCRELSKTNGVVEREGRAIARATAAAGVERFAQADRAFAVTSEIWDRDPMLLGTPGGTVDLRTGTLRPPAQADFITKITAAAPADTANCPLWLEFLNTSTGGDGEVVRFLQQWAGYCLTGDTREHALLFIYGPGGNGKTVFLNTVAGVLNDYAENRRDGDIHRVTKRPASGRFSHAKRRAHGHTSTETEEGRAWAEVRIKQLYRRRSRLPLGLCGGTFSRTRPSFKLTVIGNHKPVLRNVDDAARRRFNIVPFTRKPAVEGPMIYPDKIRAEWPGVLRWMIEGLSRLARERSGPGRKHVVEATAAYFSERGTLRQWIDQYCDEGPTQVGHSGNKLFKSWTNYAMANGEKPGTTKWFSPAMQRFGFEPLEAYARQEYKTRFQGG